MTHINKNLRKAAVFVRSLDADTAAIMLGQFSREEASSLRAAIRELGDVDPDEQADVVAEFRRTRPALPAGVDPGVELEISSPADTSPNGSVEHTVSSESATRFEFLASASTTALVRYLQREHAQTIAVVLAHLAPARAAAVLSELPTKVQADAIERLASLGEMDPDVVTELERELATWMATRTGDRGTIARRRVTVANILAAADEKTRRNILDKLGTHNIDLAQQFTPPVARLGEHRAAPNTKEGPFASQQASHARWVVNHSRAANSYGIRAPSAQRPSLPGIAFDQLVQMDAQCLNAVMATVDANVLAIALVGSDDALVDRICSQMPKRTGRAFRRELRRIGPTRLSDVEAAQRAVADVASRYLAARRQQPAAGSA